MAKHALFSPSAADGLMVCKGKLAVTADLPEQSSTYAQDGTCMHEFAAMCLERGTYPKDYIGKISDDAPGVEFTEDMADVIKVYVNYVRDLVESTGGKLFVEVAVPLEHITGEVGAHGTSDAVILTDDEVIVVDLKTGRGVEVTAWGNKQLMMYASGAIEKYGIAYDFKRARLAISQPLISHQPSEYRIDIETLNEVIAEIGDTADVAFRMYRGEIPIELTPHEDACRFCKAKPCAAQEKFVQEQIGMDFDEMLLSPKVEVALVSAEQLARSMACVDLIEGWCSAVRAKVEAELSHGRTVEGYKLVQGKKGNRQWRNAEEAETLLKKLKLKRDEMFDFKLISPTTAEKVFAERNPKQWEKVQEIVAQSEGKLSVAPISDKRPAVTIEDTANAFSTL